MFKLCSSQLVRLAAGATERHAGWPHPSNITLLAAVCCLIMLQFQLRCIDSCAERLWWWHLQQRPDLRR